MLARNIAIARRSLALIREKIRCSPLFCRYYLGIMLADQKRQNWCVITIFIHYFINIDLYSYIWTYNSILFPKYYSKIYCFKHIHHLWTYTNKHSEIYSTNLVTTVGSYRVRVCAMYIIFFLGIWVIGYKPPIHDQLYCTNHCQYP